MSITDNLKPHEFFKFFKEISAVPRGSRNRDGIAKYLCDFASERGLECIRDEYDNVIIKKDAQKSTSKNAVIIQGHTDMVTVAAPGKEKDFINEGIELCVKGDYIYADNTSLGADDGVAVCFALAVLDSKDIIHPPIEAVFTSDEEIGLIGAGKLDVKHLSGKTFLNIDSEDDGIFFSGCAGGAVCEITKSFAPEAREGSVLSLILTGLTGGHSGMEIDKKRANANKLMGSVLLKLFSEFEDIGIISFTGGEKDNAIPTFVQADILAGETVDLEKLKALFCASIKTSLKPFAETDPNAAFMLKEADANVLTDCMPRLNALELIGLLDAADDGAIVMSPSLDGVVETSSNLAKVKAKADSSEIIISVRSLFNAKRDEMTEKIKRLAGDNFNVNVSGEYSAWSHTPVSPVRDILMEEYKNVTGREPREQVIHAGLECGVFAGKMPDTDFVSFGPQADDIHTFNERLCISNVSEYWQILKNTLKRLA